MNARMLNAPTLAQDLETAGKAVIPPLPFVAPGDRLGRYEVLELLGAGGMGRVYRARDPMLNRQVALKILRPELEDGFRGRKLLWREAEALAQISHPNVVATYDAGVHEGRVFMVMELIEGMTLDERLRHERVTGRELLGAFGLAGRGLAAAHARGIVHGDFKPGNVLLSRAGRVVVVDFGCVSSSKEWLSPLRIGTPGYMAPEQVAGEPADARTDQYSFCVALEKEICNLGRGAEAEIKSQTWEVIRRGSSIQRDSRFPSMKELLGALEYVFLGLS